MDKSSGSKNFIRGGQIVLHNMRMFRQIASRVALFSTLLFIVFLLVWTFYRTTPYQQYVAKEWIVAQTKVLINKNAEQTFIQPDGESYKVYSKDILKSENVSSVLQEIVRVAYEGLIAGIVFFVALLFLIVRWLKKRGKKQTENKRINGDYLDSASNVKKEVKKNKEASDVVIGDNKIPIPYFSIKQHFLLHGTTGSGKSRLIRQLLDQIRASGDKALIYDKGGVLTEEYYQADKDILENPLDERCLPWDMWKDCRDLAELEGFAAGQIPRTPNANDPFWVDAARTIFSQAANRLRKLSKKPRLLPLLKYLLTAELSEIRQLLKGTVAETLMSEQIEKTAISIKSILATYLKSLCYVKEGDDPFSIRDWVEGNNNKQFLFITSPSDKHETLKPLITAWINLAVTALLSLPEDDNRRIWFIMDEFTSLHLLPKVEEGLAEARKFGGVFVIGVQNYPGLEKIYGATGAKSISGLLNTRCMFKQPDESIARWSAGGLGETEVEEIRESISYGANTIRDGVSISTNDNRKPVISYSEIMRLNNLECYLRLSGSYPISKIKVPYIEKPKTSERFISRNFEQDDLREEVERLIQEVKEADISESKPDTESKEEKTLKSARKLLKNKKTVDLGRALDV